MNEVDYDRGEFEKTLKEYADRFFLIPSERVWKSIYNDLHPGSKWPSLAVGLFMLITLFWVGNVNNREYPVNHPEKASMDLKTIPALPDNNFLRTPAVIPPSEILAIKAVPKNNLSLNARPSAARIVPMYSSPTAGHNKSGIFNNPVVTGASASKAALPTGIMADKIDVGSLAVAAKLDVSSVLPESVPALKGVNRDAEIISQQITLRRDRKKRVTVEYFVTPMVSNVTFRGNNLNKTNASVANSVLSSHNVNKAIKLGFMMGANLHYPISDKISVVSGIELIHTGYDIYSELEYPKTKSLTFIDKNGRMFSKNYISYYGNDQHRNDMNITNYNWQLAVPLGLEYEALSMGNVKLSVVSTFEPFMILGSRVYLLSGDASGFVTDPDLVRRFNTNANMGILLKFGGKYANWKIGPTVRYQLMSTYNHIYPVKEHYINYGLHIGVSRK